MVANQTLLGEPLAEKVKELLAAGESRFHFMVPILPPTMHAWTEGEQRAVAQELLDQALERYRALGAEATGDVGDSNPLIAIEDALLEQTFDEIILSTLPPGPSRWLKLDLPHRAAQRFSVPVTHVVGERDRSD